MVRKDDLVSYGSILFVLCVMAASVYLGLHPTDTMKHPRQDITSTTRFVYTSTRKAGQQSSPTQARIECKQGRGGAIGGAIVGGLLAGGVGALLGAIVGQDDPTCEVLRN